MARGCKAKATGPKVQASAQAESKVKGNGKQVKESITIQFGGGEWTVGELREQAIAAYVAEGHYRGNVNKLALYIKPEEHKAYYVINDKASGAVDFE